MDTKAFFMNIETNAFNLKTTNAKQKWREKVSHGHLCPLLFAVNVVLNREFKLHEYGKRQTSDSSGEFLKIENERIKTAQSNSYG